MFYNCSSLLFLDLNNFDTSSVKDMISMFFNCTSLISLDINNFHISSDAYIFYMFGNCNSLISLNLNNFYFSSMYSYEDIFSEMNPNLKYCINKSNNFLIPGINNCSDECFTNYKNKLIIEENKCIYNCSKSRDNKYEYNNICYKTCPNGTHNAPYNNFICQEDLICENYYNYNHTECIDNIPEGFYLNNSIYKTIDKCDIKC